MKYINLYGKNPEEIITDEEASFRINQYTVVSKIDKVDILINHKEELEKALDGAPFAIVNLGSQQVELFKAYNTYFVQKVKDRVEPERPLLVKPLPYKER